MTQITDPIAVVAPAPRVTAADPEAGQPTWWRIGKRVLGYGVLVLFAFVFIFPFFLAIITSFKTRPDAAANPLSLIPAPFTTDAYVRLADQNILRWAFVSVVVTVFVTLGRILLDSLAGYALARLDFPGRRTVFAVIIATLAIPPSSWPSRASWCWGRSACSTRGRA
jgi:multiple sugar transport system permease protein